MKNNRTLVIALLLCAVYLVNCGVLRAQTIATNYNNCQQGVKDHVGNWIIEPKYDYIVRDNLGYIVTVNGKCGVIDLKGNSLVPIEYDLVTPLFRWDWQDKMPDCYYTVILDKLVGVVDTAGKVIVPVRYSKILSFDDSVITALMEKNTWHFYNLKGEMHPAPWKSESEPDLIAPHRYTMRQKKFRHSTYGVTDDTGHIIVPMRYRRIEGYPKTNCMRLSTRRKYGFCSMAGQTIWPVTFTYPEGFSYYDSRFNVAGIIGVGPASVGDKVGMITIKGDTVLPFIYDNIEIFGRLNIHGQGNLWTVTQGDLKGIYDDQSGWKIPVECTEIFNVATFYTDHDSASVGLLIYQKKGLWGAMTTSGQEVLPCVYEEMIRTDDDAHVFRQGDAFMALSVCSFGNINDLVRQHNSELLQYSHYGAYCNISQVPDDKNFKTFAGNENVTAWYHPKHTHRGVWDDNHYVYIDQGKYYNFNIPDTIILSCAFYTQPVTKPVITGPGIKAYVVDRLRRRAAGDSIPSFVYVPGNKMERFSSIETYIERPQNNYYISMAGDIFRTDGSILVSGDSADLVEEQNHANDGSLYFEVQSGPDQYALLDSLGHVDLRYTKGSVCDYNPKYSWRASTWFRDWFLVDNKTGEKILGKKTEVEMPYPLWDSITIIHTSKGGRRLYNMDRRKYLTTGMNDILPLTPDGRAFAVKTCSGKMGIMNASGKWLTDTIWQALTPAHYKIMYFCNWYDFEDQASNKYYQYYVFSNDTGSVLFDVTTQALLSGNKRDDLLWKECLMPTTTTDIKAWYIDSAMSFSGMDYVEFYVGASDTGRYLPWHRQVVTDSLYGALRIYERTILPEEMDYFYYSPEPCRYCINHGVLQQAFYWTRSPSEFHDYMASFISDSLISFSAVYNEYNYPHPTSIERTWCSNVMLFPDGPHSLTIDSLFIPQSDWRGFLINTVQNYVNSHINIEGDCHNPAAIPLMLKQAFQFEATGIALYPEGFTENNAQLGIHVNWNELDPYLRNDLRPKLPVHEK